MELSKEQIAAIKENPHSCTYPWVVDWINNDLAKLPIGSIFVEFGTFVGGTMRKIAIANPHLVCHTVEKQVDNQDNNVLLNKLSADYGLGDTVQLSDLQQIQDVHLYDLENVTTHICDSVNFRLDNVAAIFIDAGHKTAEVLDDLHQAWHIIKRGGYIYGDDIDSSGVYNAVRQFAKEKNIEYTIYSKAFRIQRTKQTIPNRSIGHETPYIFICGEIREK